MAEAIVLSDGCWYIKSPKANKIRTFKQKKNTEILIPIVSKLRCFFGGADETLDEPYKMTVCVFPLGFALLIQGIPGGR